MTVYENRSLLSDYYLQERIDTHDEWSEDISGAFEAARELYRDKLDILEGANEAQTEEEFIRPLLRQVLDFPFDVRAKVTRQGRLNWPDYALFTRQQDKFEAQRRRDEQDAYYDRAIAVADAKYWGRPLDREVDDPRDELSNANPSFQIVNYLVATGVDWGVLTNGRLWRLYYARARSRVDTYYEVDLARVLEEGDLDAFRYFYHFFRAAAFEKDPQTDQSFLEAVYEGSVNYGAELERRLKELIFERIFVHLATGFLAYRRNGGAPAATREDLDAVYQGTLRLLYRLLFLLHAEARDLLPVDDRHGYYRYSLTRLKRDVAERLDKGYALSGISTDIWNDLEGLFRVIDRGDADLNVPRYNGGLFRRDEPKNAFLNEHRVPDAYLAPALDLLTRERDPETGRHVFIDYKTLDVEQLGSIYEGLLEFHLENGDGRMENGEERFQRPSSTSPPPIHLVNDKGERKATGSYYTPHYIVTYIVENALGLVLEERADRFRALMAEIEPRRERLREVERKLAQQPHRADAWATRWKNERTSLRRELEELEREAIEALLGIKVCDPAMGSGHFLVHAADWLTEHLIVVLNEFPENPVLRRIDAIRERIVEELTRQGIAIDEEQLKDTNLLKRMVMKRCIYGVDLNPMATELAKLSLWLDSFTVGAPLSFLNHHLKVGNSLIGARVEKVRAALEREGAQYHMFGGPFAGLLTATELMREVAAYTDATFEEVELSAEKYAAFEQAMLPYKRVLDLWVSRHFGNAHAEEFLRDPGQEALEAVVGEEAQQALAPRYQGAVAQARALWQEKRFFHWELEFPEVFIDLERSDWRENPGFDVVVGNPPYVRPHKLSSAIKQYFWTAFPTFVAKSDIYVCFIEQGSRLIRPGGILSLITSDGWLFLDSFEEIRRMVLDRCWVRRIADLPDGVFEDATVETVVFVLQKLREEMEYDRLETRIARAHSIDAAQRLNELSEYRVSQALFTETYKHIFDLSLTPKTVDLKHKITSAGIGLGEITVSNFGLKTGDDSIFLRQSEETSQDKPLLRGANVGRYTYQYEGEYVWYVPEKMRQHRQTARPGDPERFEEPKILIRDTLEELAGTFDDNGYYVKDVLILRSLDRDYELEYILAVLNSALIKWYYETSFPTLHVQRGELASLPIRRIAFTTPAEERERLVAEALDHERREIARNAEGPFADFRQLRGPNSPLGQWLDARLTADPEQADVVHDLLAHLAERMIALHEGRQRLEKALDPFKFLDRGAPFVPFTDAFADEIKYGELIQTSGPFDPGVAHHDIDGLRLVPVDDRWELQVQLKLRDPDCEWRSWLYESEHSIARAWTPVYRLPLDDEKARYYQHAFQVLDQFADARSFPGGYTRTTLKKLQLAQVPAFDPKADLTPLVELSEELAEAEQRIAHTDRLIDLIVYRLYGLTEEEVAVVEGENRE